MGWGGGDREDQEGGKKEKKVSGREGYSIKVGCSPVKKTKVRPWGGRICPLLRHVGGMAGTKSRENIV